jgi:hypothetical protein
MTNATPDDRRLSTPVDQEQGPRSRAIIPLAASTLGRLLARLDGDAFDTAVYGYLTALTTDPPATSASPLAGLAVDGKTLRGSRTGEGTAHLPFPTPPRPSRSNAAAPTTRPARPPSSPARHPAGSPTPSSSR